MPPEPVPKKRRSHPFLKPLTGQVKRKDIAVFDIESKAGDSQQAGFTRPFRLGFYAGDDFVEFAGSPGNEIEPWKERHIVRGGVIDNFLRWLFVLDGCKICNEPVHQVKRVRGWETKCNCFRRRTMFTQDHCLIYSHNGGKFDELFIVGWLLKHSEYMEWEISPTQSRIQRLDVWPRGMSKKKMCWSFVDSICLLPMSLKKLGETFCGVGKGKMKMDLHLPESDPRWSEYLRADCKTLYKGLETFHELIEKLGGEVGITAPSTSMKLFRRAYMKTWITRNQHFAGCDGKCKAGNGINKFGHPNICPRQGCEGACHGCAHDWIRGGYYGGRTELFKRHGRKVHYYDINSSYAASMSHDMPVGKMIELKSTRLEAVEHMARTHIGFVECTVEIPKGCKIPPLPYRKGGKLIFPTAQFSGVWSMAELELLKHPLVQGRIVTIKKSVWYKKSPVFREMTYQLYSYRQKSSPNFTEGMSAVAKLMGNSLYGKFATREDRTGLVVVAPGDEKPENGWPINGKHDCPIWEVERTCSAAYIVPQISAHITALSRIRLWLKMAWVIEQGGELYYVDTDSIMASIRMEQSDGLGGWKEEEPGIMLEGDFVLPKLYRLKRHKLTCMDKRCDGCAIVHEKDCDDKTCKGCGKTSVHKMKGVGSRAQTAENWKKMVEDGGLVEFDRLSQVRTMLNKRMVTPEVVRARKSIRTQYDKRIVQRDGSTVPIAIGA
jgi:hypothetical protein